MPEGPAGPSRPISHMFHQTHRLSFACLFGWALNLVVMGGTSGAALQRVTSHPAMDYQPSVSAKGDTLAFVSTRSGNPDIWVQRLATSGISLPRQVTTHPAHDLEPALNRDGTRLLYVSHKTDPRGDLYLLDLITKEERRLTDLSSGDTLPQWDKEEKGVYFLKTAPLAKSSHLYWKSLSDSTETLLIEDVKSFSVDGAGHLLYSDGRRIHRFEPRTKQATTVFDAQTGLALWPTAPHGPSSQSDDGRVLFTRYDRDSNGDGVIDADDESSLWMVQAFPDHSQPSLLYQLTPNRRFDAYPAASGSTVYFSDLKAGEIFRLNLPKFLKDYASLEEAEKLAGAYRDSGQLDQAVLVLTNISHNLLRQATLDQRADFDFGLAEIHTQQGQYQTARALLTPYIQDPGRIAVLATIHTISLNVKEQARQVSSAKRKRLVEEGVAEMLKLGNQHPEWEDVRGEALIQAGRLYLLANDPLTALEHLVQVDDLQDADIRAKGLFARGEAYRVLGDTTNVLQVFVDVIRLFGEDTSWGRRAIHQAIELSQKDRTPQEAITSLNQLIAQHPDLPALTASARLQAANRYHDLGEQLAALEALDSIVTASGIPRDLTILAYQKKGEWLSRAERFQEAADTYAALQEFAGEGQVQWARTQDRLILQLVKKALKDRRIGETRIAAKSLKHLIDQYPESVEAHRAYIETKAMLRETPEVLAWYNRQVKEHPDHAVYRYGQALAMSYMEPLDISRVINLLNKALEQNPSISYIHQTLGWAYEQQERMSGKSGFLEQAEKAYRIALDLNDAELLPDVESQLLLNLGNTYLALGNVREAYRFYRQRDEQFSPAGDTTTEMLYRKNYGQACFRSGRSREAVAQYQSALRRVPPDQAALKAQLLERLGLAHQDLGEHALAIEAFTQALDINRDLGNAPNIALLKRNIGVNLFNLSQTDRPGDRTSLKRALDSYFRSLTHLTRMGTQTRERGPGLIQLDVGLSDSASQAARGFDKTGEEKLMFSYIAGTYEQLEAPGPAREFLEKKLALLNRTDSKRASAAVLTEKAVVLNQIGVLSHQLGEPLQAMDFIRQSLQYTRLINSIFGTSVNLYNLSRLAVEEVRDGRHPDPGLVEMLVEGIDDLRLARHEDRHLFFTLTNTALLLSLHPPSDEGKPGKWEDTVKHLHRQFRYGTLPWSYYQQAKTLLQQPALFSDEERPSLTFLVKLNLAELAKDAPSSTAFESIRGKLKHLVEDQGGPQGWLWHLFQAETASEDSGRKAHVTRAVETVLQFPAQTDPMMGIDNLWPMYDRLVQLVVDQAITDGRPEQGFVLAEQLQGRQQTGALYETLGEDFFLTGLGDYAPELKSILAEIRQARQSGAPSGLDQLAPILEEILYALYEEYPWAAASFWAYPPGKDLMALTLDSRHPYVKIIQGQRGYHGFVHNGQSLHYSPVTVTDGALQGDQEFHKRIRQAASAYLSLPPSLSPEVLPGLTQQDKPITRVANFYEFLSGFHQRSLFFSRLATTADFHPPVPIETGGIPLTVQPFTGDHNQDRTLAAQTNIAVFLTPPDRLSFEVQRERGVRESISVSDFAGSRHHSLLLLGGLPTTSPSSPIAVAAFLRAGFPHVIASSRPLPPETAGQWFTRYLEHLQTLPPDEAVTAASRDLWGSRAGPYGLRLYGFAGMDAEERRDYAVSVYAQEQKKAIQAFQAKQFSESLMHIEQTLALIDYAGKQAEFKDLSTLAVETAFEIGNYEKGLFFQRKLLDTMAAGTAPHERAEALYRLGILYSRLEQFDEAVRHLEEATQIWKAADELDRLAEGIATLGVVQENRGDYPEALDKFRESFSLFEEIGEMGQTAFQYRRMGRIYYLRLGRYEKAREHFQQALDLYRQQGDPEGEAEVLYEIGLTREKMALFGQASDLYQEALEIGLELDIPFLIATGHLYLANIAWFQGDYQTAFQRLTQADKAAEEAHDAQLRIMVRNTRGLMYWTLNDPDKGLFHLHEAVKLSEAANIQTELASSLNNLGLIYRQQGDHHTALEQFTRAKEIDEALQSQWGLGYDHRNIGMSLQALGQLKEAESHFLKAERISAEIHNVINWVKALLELGNVNRALAQPEPALAYYEQAYDVSKKHGIKEVEWRAAAGKGALLREKSQASDALSWFSKAVEVVEGMRATLKIDELRNSFQTNKLDLYRDVITLLIEMNRSDEAFNYLERSRSRSFIDLLGNQKLSFKNEEDQETWDRINQLGSTLESMQSELGSYEEPPADLQKRYRQLRTQYEEAILVVKQQNPGLSSFVAVDPLDLQGIQDLLEPKVGLISYFMTTDHLYLWLITRNQTLFRKVSAGEEELTRLITRYRQSVQHVEPVDDELQQLYQWLIAPLADPIADLEFLGIIPDGPLHFLSFAALKHGPAYLVEEIPLFYAPSASVLEFTFAKRQAEKNERVLAIGNPDLGSYNYELPLAELEAHSIRWNYPQMDILTGSKATKEWVIDNISRYGIIHLAAHGEFDEFNPLLSSLWLASPNPENRRLTVKEVFSLELNADLVTLSACQTGLGKLEAGELIGLNRAFIYAGTHALVSALWRVDDLSTSVLMKHFYRNYVTQNKARSLRQAQLIVKRDFPHPSYWAGFSLIGDFQ